MKKKTCISLLLGLILLFATSANAQRCVRGGSASWTSQSIGYPDNFSDVTDSILFICDSAKKTLLLECFYSRIDPALQTWPAAIFAQYGVTIVIENFTGAGTYDVNAGSNTAGWRGRAVGIELCPESSGTITINNFDTNKSITGSFDFDVECQSSGNWEASGTFATSVYTVKINAFDPNPEFVDDNGKVLTSYDKLTQLTHTAVGTIADGVSKALLLIHTPVPLLIGVSGTFNGYLTLLDGTSLDPTIPVSPTIITGDTVIACLYIPPLTWDANEADDSTASFRYVNISAVSNDGNYTGNESLELHKVPVVLVHGMWSGPEVWDQGARSFRSFLESNGFYVATADYEKNSTASFEANTTPQSPGIEAVQVAVLNTVNYFWSSHIAASQVDIVAHSLGGLMARGFAAETSVYQTTGNYEAGYFHRLITLGTPHLGTSFGGLLYNATSDQKKWLNVVLRGKNIGDCHRDFDYIDYPSALKSLGMTTVPSHAIVGTWFPAPTGAADYALLSKALAFVFPEKFRIALLTYPTLFPSEAIENDLVVPESSGSDNLPISAVSTFAGTLHSNFVISNYIDTNATLTKSQQVQDEVKSLLLVDQTLPAFASGFPAVSGTERRKELPLSEMNQADIDSTGLKIIAPSPGSVYHPGDTMLLTVEASKTPSDGILVSVSSLGLDSMVGIGPYSAQIIFPSDCAPGAYSVTVFGTDSLGNFMLDSIPISITMSSNPDSLIVEPSFISLNANVHEEDLYVRAIYDSIEINVGNGGVSYTTGKGSSVVNVAPDGTVTAVATGSDSITVAFANKEVIVPVTVLSVLSSVSLPTSLSELSVLSIFPDPASSTVTLSYVVPSSADVHIELFNSIGISMLKSDFGEGAGNHDLTLDVSNLTRGTYFCRLSFDGHFEVKPFEVTH